MPEPQEIAAKRTQLTAEIKVCPDCRANKRHAYSDGTTPGFFYTECNKHRAAVKALDSQPSPAFEKAESAASMIRLEVLELRRLVQIYPALVDQALADHIHMLEGRLEELKRRNDG